MPFNKLPQYNIQGQQIGNNPDRAMVEFGSMSVGGNGFTIGTTASSISASNVDYYSFTTLAATVIASITFPSYYRGTSNLVGISIPAGVTIFGSFTNMTLTSGTVIAYYTINMPYVDATSAGEDYYPVGNL